MKKQFLASLCAMTLMAGSFLATVDAHGVFFANRLDEKALVLGEGPVDNVYSPSCVTGLQGYSINWMPMEVEKITHEHNIAIVPTEKLGATVTFFDYGYFTKNKEGKTIHKPISEVPDAVKSTHAIKYNIAYWNADIKPTKLENVPIQIVPAVNPLTLRKGDKLEIQVFKDGKPMANAPLIADVINDLTNESTTDVNGRATVTVAANGLNVIGVEIAYPTGTPGEQNKYFSSLSFIIDPE